LFQKFISNNEFGQFATKCPDCLFVAFERLVKEIEKIFVLGRGLLAKIISFRGTHVGNTWFGVYLKGI
jgi:hypothetical protein